MNTHRVFQNQESKFIVPLMNYWKNFRYRFSLQFVVCLALVLGLAYSSRAQSCSTCNDEKATIGFTGSVCSAHNYTITLDGLSVTGAGSCTANSWVTANKAYKQLTVDKTYILTAGTDSCSTHIVFDVPEQYKLEIDGIETTVIDKSGGTKGSGDGTWKIVVRKCCKPCEGAGFGKTCDIKLGSVDLSVNMGKLSDGRSAESIHIIQDTLTGSIYTPSALIYSPPGLTQEIDVVQNPDQSLRQIKTTEGLADIVVTIAGQEYEIRFYRPVDVGTKVNGLYGVSGQPNITWRVKNPDPSSISRLQISKIQGGFTDTSEYAWDVVTDSWTLTRGGGALTETRAVTFPTATSRMVTTITKESNGQIVSKVVRIYRTYSWGEELFQEIVDPDGAALKTDYTYYENTAEAGRYTKIKSISHPDGSWEKYDYDTSGNNVLTMRPWKDLTLASATEANSRATRYTYSNFDGVVTSLHARELSSIEEKIAGVLVRKTTYSRTGVTINGNPATREVETVHASASATQTTTTTRYHYSADSFYANRTISVEFADGRTDTYSYEKGNYVPNPDPSLSQFTPDANGAAQRQTLVHGTVAAPSGVAFKTTQETSVRDQYGREVLQESYVFNGATYERTGWTAMDYDDLGQLTQTRRHNGEVITNVWNGDRKISQIDADGVQTDYTYDALVRIKTQTKKGVAANGSFPAQADIVTTYNYNAKGRPVGETISSGTLSLSRTIAYDLAGRMKSETDHACMTTNFTYANGGRTRTVIRPGGATSVTDNYLDNQVKSITGTAVVARYVDYGVNANGTRYTQEFMGNSGLFSPRWTKTTSDWLGRTITVETPSFTGTLLVQISTYNNKGQLQAETFTVNAAKLLADKLYEYDEMGNQIRSGSDIDTSGTLTLASTDRITEVDMSYEKVGSDWFRVTTTRTYLVANDATPTIQTQRERLNNFALSGSDQTVSESSVTDVAGNISRVTSTIDRAARKTITVTDTPESNVDAISISVNGLLQSSSTNTPQPATTYTYDGLGRQLAVTDPRTGTTTQAYEATTGRLLSTSDAVSTTTYEYYPATHINAGRMKSQTNAAGKKTYFEYSARGELVRTWGDAVYPVEYVYDSYGQKSELHTFRSGSNWQSSVWPVATTGTVDVTRWTYHEPTGLLTQKQDATLKGASYTYDELGRIKIRTWARLDSLGNPLRCTYTYDPLTGELIGIDYSDTTPDVTLGYDRGGRQSSITDAAGTHARSFNVAGELQTDQITGGILDLVQISTSFDSFLRRQFLQASRGGNVLTSQIYAYDPTSRLETITSGGQTATYAYHPTSGLLNTTTFTGGTNIAKSYDTLGRLQSITTTPASGSAQSYTYTVNNLHQRTRVTREDGSYWAYIYNDRGELTSGKKYWVDNSPVWGNQTEYSLDNVGNRNASKSGGNPLGQLRQSNYTANSVNQYSQRTVPGAVDITGTANNSATVSVNDGATTRRADYFYREVAVDNSAAPVYPQVLVVGARNNFGAGGEDAVTETGGAVFVPRAVETFTYDDDGNLTSDGRWNYTWDAENRLIKMEALASVPVGAKRRLDFAYDWMGRRIQKTIYDWNVTTGTYKMESPTNFVYDGWNVMAELDATTNTLLSSYTWGMDLSGSLQGMGGIGGLLTINSGGNTHIAGYDGNGNLTTLVAAATGTISASYEFDPFGNTLKSIGEFAEENPFRFSTKRLDQETGLLYYGYRYYNPQTGKWLSRDPSGEDAGVNLYRFNDNDPVYYVDPLGLQVRSDRNWYPGERNPRTGRRYGDSGTYDKNTPNWKFARGQMHYSYHRVQLCIPNLTTNEAMNRIYDDLRQFNHFSSPVQNIAAFTRSGDKGHFSVNGAAVAGASWIVGNSIDIIVLERSAQKEVIGITIGDHPLVGVRKWRPEKAGELLGKKGGIIDVVTEAYERPSGMFNDWFYSLAQQGQNEMWLIYLQNIAIYWHDHHKATDLEWEKVQKKVPGTINPFRAELPAELQNSRITYR
jgi:RHS repeat-associated protein